MTTDKDALSPEEREAVMHAIRNVVQLSEAVTCEVVDALAPIIAAARAEGMDQAAKIALSQRNPTFTLSWNHACNDIAIAIWEAKP